MAGTKNTAGGYELLVRELKKDPGTEYATLREKAEASGLTVYPVMFGRAKAALGLVASKPRKEKQAKRGPGRPKGSKNKVPRGAKTPAPLDLNGLDGLAMMVRELQRERDDAVAKLERIRALLG